jgi:DNA-binding transcriptional LysR family regulator
MRDRLTVAVPRRHALASRQEVCLHELADETWIHVPDVEVPRELITEALRDQPYRPSVILERGDMQSAQALVAAGVGIALVPDLARCHDADVRHIPISGSRVGRSIYCAVRTSAPQDSGVSEMLDALAAVGRRMTIWPTIERAVRGTRAA